MVDFTLATGVFFTISLLCYKTLVGESGVEIENLVEALDLNRGCRGFSLALGLILVEDESPRTTALLDPYINKIYLAVT